MFLQLFANTLAAAIDRAEAERLAQASLGEKEVLLQIERGGQLSFVTVTLEG